MIPEGYGAALAAGDAPPDLVLYRDPAKQIASQVMVFQLSPVLFQQTAEGLGSRMMNRVTDLMDLPEASRGAITRELVGSYLRVEDIMDGVEAAAAEAADAGDTSAPVAIRISRATAIFRRFARRDRSIDRSCVDG